MSESNKNDLLLEIDFSDVEGITIEEEQPKEIEDFCQTTLDDYEQFEQKAWSKGNGYKIPSFPSIEEKLEGLESGLYLFAAESNVGKSALMLNMMYSISTCEDNNLFGIYYSLDDSKFEIIPRVIAMDQGIPIGAASKPQRIQARIDNGEEDTVTYEEWLAKREAGLERLKNNSTRFKIEDTNRIKNSDDLYNHMKELILYVRATNKAANIIVGIDSINDIKPVGRFNNAADKNATIATMVKDWAVELDIPIFGSIHLRKLNANRRPTLDDLKESVEYVYEASVVWLLYNDVSKNKQSAKIYRQDPSSQEKFPVIEIDWAKNKKSSYKGRSFCYFSPEFSRVVECDEQRSRAYESAIYNNIN